MILDRAPGIDQPDWDLSTVTRPATPAVCALPFNASIKSHHCDVKENFRHVLQTRKLYSFSCRGYTNPYPRDSTLRCQTPCSLAPQPVRLGMCSRYWYETVQEADSLWAPYAKQEGALRRGPTLFLSQLRQDFQGVVDRIGDIDQVAVVKHVLWQGKPERGREEFPPSETKIHPLLLSFLLRHYKGSQNVDRVTWLLDFLKHNPAVGAHWSTTTWELVLATTLDIYCWLDEWSRRWAWNGRQDDALSYVSASLTNTSHTPKSTPHERPILWQSWLPPNDGRLRQPYQDWLECYLVLASSIRRALLRYHRRTIGNLFDQKLSRRLRPV